MHLFQKFTMRAVEQRDTVEFSSAGDCFHQVGVAQEHTRMDASQPGQRRNCLNSLHAGVVTHHDVHSTGVRH